MSCSLNSFKKGLGFRGYIRDFIGVCSRQVEIIALRMFYACLQRMAACVGLNTMGSGV